VNTRKATRIGSVGKALPRFEISISDDGEVLVRGGRDRGYWHDAAATTAVLDADGWFHTGPRSLDVMASSRSRGGRSPGRRRARA
jgi:long-chain acyl-CoA synthetase